MLRQVEAAANEEDVRAAALQFVRKISGYRQPSRQNQAAFDAAVAEIAEASLRLLVSLTPPRPRRREAEGVAVTLALASRGEGQGDGHPPPAPRGRVTM